MSWEDIKNTPRHELEGLLAALGEYNILHSFDGYTAKDVAELQKNNPNIAGQYADYKERQRKYSKRKEPVTSLYELMG